MISATKRYIGSYAQFLSQKASWILCILSVLLLTFRLGDYYLLDKDEPRYPAAAREMLDLGKLIVPQFNFEARYEKPILFYWVEMISLKLFGVNEFAARIPSVVAALALLFLLYHVARNFNVQLIAPMILLTSVQFFIMSRLSIIDMLLNLFFSGVILFFYLSCLSPQHKHYLYYAAVCAGLGTLTKGPIAVLLPGLIIIIFLLLKQNLFNFIQEYRKQILLSLAIILAISLPWYLLVDIESAGDFTRVFFGEEHLARFNGTLQVHKASPFWFYLPVVAIGFLPWTLFLPRIGWDIFSPLFRRQPIIIENPLISLCLVWAITVLVFFSIVGVKLINYILPIYLPLALITAIWINSHQALRASLPKIFTVIYLLLFAAVPLILEPYAIKRQSNIALFASTVPEYSELIAVDYLPPSLVFYSKRSRHIEQISKKRFISRNDANNPVYFIAKREQFKDLAELNDCCEIFSTDEKFIYGKKL